MRIGQGAVPSVDVTDRAARDLGFVREHWLRRIATAQAFSFSDGLTAGAGTFIEEQLFNPVGSLITVTVYAIVFSTTTTQQLLIQRFNTALVTPLGNGVNLDMGSAAAVAELRRATPAAIDGTGLGIYNVLANTPTLANPMWHARLTAGEGILVAAGTVATRIDVNWFWIEE